MLPKTRLTRAYTQNLLRNNYQPLGICEEQCFHDVRHVHSADGVDGHDIHNGIGRFSSTGIEV